MGLNFKNIETLLIEHRNSSKLVRLIVDYSILKNKLENQNTQSWYFKQAKESNDQKIEALIKEFEEIRKIYNESSIDYFIECLNENTTIKVRYENHGMNTIQQMHYSFAISKINFFNELIRLKNKTEVMKSMDYYIENPEEFIDFIT